MWGTAVSEVTWPWCVRLPSAELVVPREAGVRGRSSVSAGTDGVSQPWGQPGAEGQWLEGGGSFARCFLKLRMCALPHPWPGWRCAGQ